MDRSLHHSGYVGIIAQLERPVIVKKRVALVGLALVALRRAPD